MRIGIVGMGFVGKTLYEVLQGTFEVIPYDKYKDPFKENLNHLSKCGVTFIAVPTPMKDSGEIDKTILHSSIETLSTLDFEERPLITIRSTVTPGTTEYLVERYNQFDFVFNPEFLREKHAIEDFKTATRVVLGVNNEKDFRTIKSIYEKVVPNTKYIMVDFKTAELAKYLANATLAGQIILANELHKICECSGVDYNKAREILILDPRVGANTEVPGPDGDYGFGGKCFPKDLNALIHHSIKSGYSPSLLKEVWTSNLRFRKKRDWEEIPGATSKNSSFYSD